MALTGGDGGGGGEIGGDGSTPPQVWQDDDFGGHGGTATGGGAGGKEICGGGGAAGAPGAALTGGGSLTSGGGGGGSGWFGGGQGSGGSGVCALAYPAGGGGGGSSHVGASVTATGFTTGARSGDGEVVISYINPVTAVDDAYSTAEGQTLTVPAPGLLANDTYPEGSYVAPGWSGHGTAHGTVTISVDGSFTYTPDSGFTGTDSFGYLVKSLGNDYATADVTITVQGARTVTFEPENGEAAFTQTVHDGSTANEPAAPSRPGYAFTGWFSAATGGTRWDFSTPVTRDLTLYAQWKSDTDTVRFDPHNGEPTFTQTVGHGQPVTEPKTPTRAGWVFQGWYTAATRGAAWDYSTPVTHALTLHAQWTSVTVDPGSVAQGREITVTGRGFWPGENVAASVHSDPLDLGTYRADARGAVTFTATVPVSIPAGIHDVTLTGAASAHSASAALTVTQAAAPTSGGGGSLAATGIDARGLLGPGLLLLIAGIVTTAVGCRRRPLRR